MRTILTGLILTAALGAGPPALADATADGRRSPRSRSLS
jgi:hypothetical protein